MGKTCPCCEKIELRRAIRRGVEIDYCPECNGIWLDNGELNKIVSESIESTGEEKEVENCQEESSEKKSRKSIVRSFLNIIGSTKDDSSDDDEPDSNSDPDPDFTSSDDSA